MNDQRSAIPALAAKHQQKILGDWLKLLLVGSAFRSGRIKEAELREQASRFLDGGVTGLQSGSLLDIQAPAWEAARRVLEEISRSWATNGFSPSETAMFVFSLKQPLFDLLREEAGKNPDALAHQVWAITLLLDSFGLYSTEAYMRGREELIRRQQRDLLELSTPVVELWDGVLALPVIGTLDSERTQTVMENLLQRIVETGAEIAIIDITGVPTVDTLVAQHLIKTVSAARLMGADCIISGIRPQIAQTIVHLGLELGVISKATMADAFALALRRTGRSVIDKAKAPESSR